MSTTDPIVRAELAYAASTHAEGDEAVMYVAAARMAMVEITERLEVLGRAVLARERELSRVAMLARGKP